MLWATPAFAGGTSQGRRHRFVAPFASTAGATACHTHQERAHMITRSILTSSCCRHAHTRPGVNIPYLRRLRSRLRLRDRVRCRRRSRSLLRLRERLLPRRLRSLLRLRDVRLRSLLRLRLRRLRSLLRLRLRDRLLWRRLRSVRRPIIRRQRKTTSKKPPK